jgi:CTP:molybdopterin cytidylyltransferase MocA
MKQRAKSHPPKESRAASKRARIVPIILAAGAAPRLGFPQALARFGGRTAIEIAVRNCAEIGAPIVVLGWFAWRVRAAVPRGARVVVHSGWRAGQLSSLRAGLRRVPRGAAFMLYPVDYPLLMPKVIRRLAAGFQRKRTHQTIVVPVFRGRAGHPVIFSSTLRSELARASNAREVVLKDPRRVKLVPVATSAIWHDFDSLRSYYRLSH